MQTDIDAPEVRKLRNHSIETLDEKVLPMCLVSDSLEGCMIHDH